MTLVSLTRSLVLPPPFTPYHAETDDVLSEACRLAPEEGAGCLVWRWVTSKARAGRLDFAVVLEPETPLAEARRAFIIGMVALGQALAAHCPPEREVRFGWPGGIILDTSRLGGMRLAIAPGTAEDAVPDWMVLGVELIADRDHLERPGDYPHSVSLKEEEFDDPPAVLETFASYLMLNFDRWKHEGFAGVAERYDRRLTDEGKLTEMGDLTTGDSEAALADALGGADWRDAEGPRL